MQARDQNKERDPDRIFRVLVADDDPEVLQDYCLALQSKTDDSGAKVNALERELFDGPESDATRRRLEIITCRQGEEAVEIVRKAKAEKNPITVSFMDVRMPPGINGVEAAKKIREIDQRIEIVIVTAYSDIPPEKIVDKVGKKHKLIYLNKPFSAQVIRQLADTLCAKWVNEINLLNKQRALKKLTEEQAAQLISSRANLMNEVARKNAAQVRSRESEELYGSLIQITREAVFVHYAGHIVDANDLAEKRFGYSHSELIGRELTSLFERDCRKEIENASLERDSPLLQVRGLTRTGDTFPAEASFKRIRFRERDMWLTVVQDISEIEDARELLDTERKSAEKAIRESEERFRLLAENATDIIWTMNLDMKFTYHSPSVERILGYPVDQANTLSLEELLPGNSLAIVDRVVERSLRREREGTNDNEPVRLELQQRKKDGTLIWTESAVDFIRDAKGKPLGLVGVTRDITERKIAEDKLAQSRRMMLAILESMPVGVVMIDSKGEIRNVNKALLSMMDIASVDMIEGRKYVDCFQYGMHVDPALPRAGDLRRTVLSTPEGKVIPIIKSAVAVMLEGEQMLLEAFVDITGQMEAEQAELQMQQRYRALFDSIGDAIFIHTPDGKILEVNRAACRRLEYDRDDLLQMNINDFTRPEDAFEDVPATGPLQKQGRHVFESAYITRNQEIVPVEINCRMIEFDGEWAVLAVARDIRERKAAESEKSRLEQQLSQSQKMQAIGRLAGGVAHDFNNMLTAINVYSELLINALDEGTPEKDDALEIKKAADRARELTRQLLAFSRKQIISPQIIDINFTIEQSHKMLCRLIGENIQQNFDGDPGLWPIRIDPAQLDQILMNLVINAKDAMPDGGNLNILTRNRVLSADELQGNPEIAPGEFVMVEVCDTGHGMDENTLESIFEPFFTTKEEGRGTGLGLSTVFGITKQNGGHIQVESEPGRGTTFRIFFPRVTESSTALQPTSADEFRQGTETILLVEDDEQVRDLGRRVLENQGYTVHAASGGIEAIALSDTCGECLDLLVTDVFMPEMNGGELAEILLQTRPNLKVLYMSGYGDQVIAEQGVLRQGIHLLQKPFSYEGIGKAVRKALDG